MGRPKSRCDGNPSHDAGRGRGIDTPFLFVVASPSPSTRPLVGWGPGKRETPANARGREKTPAASSPPPLLLLHFLVETINLGDRRANHAYSCRMEWGLNASLS